VKALDSGNLDLVLTEEARDMQRCRLVGLTDLGRSLFLFVERLDADHLALLVVVEIRARLAAQAEHLGDRRRETGQARLNDRCGSRETFELGLRLPLFKSHSPTPHPPPSASLACWI